MRCSAPIEIAPRRLVSPRRRDVGTQRDFQIAIDLRLHSGRFDETELHPDPQIQLDVDIVAAGGPILVVFRHLVASEQHQLRSFEHRAHGAGVLLPLIELLQFHGGESLASVESPSLDPVVVDADSLVRIANRQIHRQIVVERAVVDVELRE